MSDKTLEQYSREVIDLKMESIHEKLDLILEQTTAHNGRMRNLEIWKATTLGIMSTGTVIAGLIIYIWSSQIGDILETERNMQIKMDTHFRDNNSSQNTIINNQEDIINNQ